MNTPDKILTHFRGGTEVLLAYYLAILSPEERERHRGAKFSISVITDPEFKVALIDDAGDVLMTLPAEPQDHVARH
ncbi:MAG: hypothetical protein WD078_08795 [Woeseia sp.]